MKQSPRIEAIDLSDPILNFLACEASEEGFQFLNRLLKDISSGANTFSKLGERFVGVYHGDELIAVGGLNCDPYTTNSSDGRLRHIYVRSSYRKRGVGRMLVAALLRSASKHFRTIRLKTDTDIGARFYESIGFQRTIIPNVTHILQLRFA